MCRRYCQTFRILLYQPVGCAPFAQELHCVSFVASIDICWRRVVQLTLPFVMIPLRNARCTGHREASHCALKTFEPPLCERCRDRCSLVNGPHTHQRSNEVHAIWILAHEPAIVQSPASLLKCIDHRCIDRVFGRMPGRRWWIEVCRRRLCTWQTISRPWHHLQRDRAICLEWGM